MLNFERYVLATLFLASSLISSAQTPTPATTPAQENPRIRNFGSSLKSFEKKDKSNDSGTRNADSVADDIIRVKTALVVNDVLVTNAKSNIINGLTKADFIVTEDGTPQTIQMFEPADSATVPQSFVLILDCQAPQGPYLKSSIEAAKLLVDNLKGADTMALVTTDLKIRLDFTRDKSFLKNTLNLIGNEKSPVWGGMQFSTLLATLNEIFDPEVRRRTIIFQGGGNEAIWLRHDKNAPYQVSDLTLYKSGMRYTGEKAIKKWGFGDLKEAIERSGTTIYSIIPGIRFLGFSRQDQMERSKKSLMDLIKFYHWDKETSLSTLLSEYQIVELERRIAGQTLMVNVADISGGNTGFIEKPEDADEIYSEIFKIIENRYVLGYYPTDQENGRLRNLRIEVRNHPEYTVMYRKSYVLTH